MLNSLKFDTNNFSSTKYLSDYDLINKYNLKSIHLVPKLKNIVLEISSKNFILSCDLGGKKDFDVDLQIKSFFILYSLLGLKPFIKFNQVMQLQEENFQECIIKVNFSSYSDKTTFLRNIFIENWDKLLVDDFLLIKTTNTKNYFNDILDKKTFVLNTKIPSFIFYEIENFLNKFSLNINSKNLFLKAHFVFCNKSTKKIKSSLNLIKNLPLFWISG